MDLQERTDEIIFPQTFQIKIICEASPDEKQRQHHLQAVMDNHRITCGSWSQRLSGGGKYTSHRTTITAPDKATLEALYAALGKVPGVRMVL